MVLLDNDGVSSGEENWINHALLTFFFFLIFQQKFLSGVTKLFQQTRHSGSIFLTMKKCKRQISQILTLLFLNVFLASDNGRTKPHPKQKKKGKKAARASPRKAASPEPEENLCLLRASNGKKHISTVVSAKEVTRFQLVCFGYLLRMTYHSCM